MKEREGHWRVGPDRIGAAERLLRFRAHFPSLHESSWVAPSATLIGEVMVGQDASVWYGSVLRADGDAIMVGSSSNIQDGCVLHADPGLPVTIRSHVSVGHRAVLHGCTIEDNVLVGMGAIILNGARIGRGSLVAAGAVVPEDAIIPPHSLVAGVPGRIRRETTTVEQADITANAEAYVELAVMHRGEGETPSARQTLHRKE